jgi:hypothetical protein
MNATSEVQPHLIVWQVGINDALAQAEVAHLQKLWMRFSGGLPRD